MMQNEKDKLIALFGNERNWCQDFEARDEQGEPVPYNDETAVAWDLVGGMCHLFGWARACKLFVQLGRHISGPQRPRWMQDEEMVAMAALQEFNDSQETTHELVMTKLNEMPVWSREASLS
jgi:hypothetical protein